MPLSHAILGFLDFAPMSGYDLKKFFDQSVAHFWSATQSHIYKALETLEEEGFVKSKIIPQEGRPNRKEYHITETGHAELQRWVATPLPLSVTREAWLIQIFFSNASSNEQIAALLRARAQNIREALDAFQEQPPDQGAAASGTDRMKSLWKITGEYGAAYYEFELEWLNKTIKKIGKLPLK